MDSTFTKLEDDVILERDTSFVANGDPLGEVDSLMVDCTEDKSKLQVSASSATDGDNKQMNSIVEVFVKEEASEQCEEADCDTDHADDCTRDNSAETEQGHNNVKFHATNDTTNGGRDISSCSRSSQEIYATLNKLQLKRKSLRKSRANGVRPKSLRCPDCQYSTEYREYFKKHSTKVHFRSVFFECVHCKFVTLDESNLRRHVGATHLKPFKCELCNYTAALQVQLQSHKEKIHEHKKTYNCSKCSFGAFRRTDLANHINGVHLRQKPFKCPDPDCNYATAWPLSLKKHTLSIHMGQKTFKCPDCPYETIWKSTFNNHIMAIHLKQKPYKCSDCDFRATRQASIKKHRMAVHLGEKAYRCPECDYGATQRVLVQKHQLAVHGGLCSATSTAVC